MKHLGLLFGGKSAEHNISIRSARSVFEKLDKSKYYVHLIWIDNDGTWYAISEELFAQTDNDIITFQSLDLHEFTRVDAIEVFFPMLHGTYGEDGTMQGLMRIMEKPFVGVDVLASSLCMDKDLTKRVLRDAGIGIADYVCLKKHNPNQFSFEQIKEKLGIPFFVKPSRAGSSVGVHKVDSEEGYKKAVEDGFQYDNKLLIEEGIDGIEVECAILGNEDPQPSVLGAIIPSDTFYSFEAKYESEDGAKLEMPAKLEDGLAKRIQDEAVKAFIATECEGLSRVDFFLKKDNTFIINEINTMPGFTSISMYPQLWGLTGVGYTDLLDKLIELALSRFERDSKLKTL